MFENLSQYGKNMSKWKTIFLRIDHIEHVHIYVYIWQRSSWKKRIIKEKNKSELVCNMSRFFASAMCCICGYVSWLFLVQLLYLYAPSFYQRTQATAESVRVFAIFSSSCGVEAKIRERRRTSLRIYAEKKHVFFFRKCVYTRVHLYCGFPRYTSVALSCRETRCRYFACGSSRPKKVGLKLHCYEYFRV